MDVMITSLLEDWRSIPGYDAYEVSSAGRVRSTGWPELSRSGRVLKAQKLEGYPTVGLYKRRKKIHVLMALAFFGPPGEGEEVRHLNGDRSDNRLENLAYGTRSDNVQDMIRHGTSWSQKKTHCPQEHLLQEPNLNPALLRRTGHRECLACRQAGRYMTKHPEMDFRAEADHRYQKIMGSDTPQMKATPADWHRRDKNQRWR